MCYLYLILNILPIWPIYFLGIPKNSFVIVFISRPTYVNIALFFLLLEGSCFHVFFFGGGGCVNVCKVA
jgi:hypothetical protein